MEHKHDWRWSGRKHKRKGYRFKECIIPGCGAVMQVSPYGMSFQTGVERGGETKVKSYRLKQDQEKFLKGQGMTFVQFVDNAFREQMG